MNSKIQKTLPATVKRSGTTARIDHLARLGEAPLS
ncbi:MAG: hypothetical protein QOD04_5915 [Pseudonocardiales bacterium]|nr:hypothetical protein [Pseudonocardiales bacterium]